MHVNKNTSKLKTAYEAPTLWYDLTDPTMRRSVWCAVSVSLVGCLLVCLSQYCDISSSHSAQEHLQLSPDEKVIWDTLQESAGNVDSLCRLCELYIEKRNYIAAYRYALRALLLAPHQPRGHWCLSKIYFLQENFLRAAFYAELVASSNSTRHAVDPIHRHAIELISYILHTYPSAILVTVDATKSHFKSVHSVFAALDGSRSLYETYVSVLPTLPLILSGPYILHYEAFLDLVETIIKGYLVGSTRTSVHSIPSPVENIERVHELPELLWPLETTLILYLDLTTMSTFGENLLGLSDALNTLGIPHRLTTSALSGPDFLAIEAMSPTKKVFGREYLMWSFEKNPTMVSPEEMATGFHTDECKRDEARYSRWYVDSAVMIWETIPSNIIKWRKKLSRTLSHKLILVPCLIPLRVLALAQAEFSFADTLNSTYSSNEILRMADESKPIDILFYGSCNDHRKRVLQELQEFAYQHSLKVHFLLNYSAFFEKLDHLVDQSKIVLSLANTDWPISEAEANENIPLYCGEEPGDIKPHGAAANLHRIKALLGRASQRSGSSLDEEFLGGVVIFVDTSSLRPAILALLQDPPLRRELEARGLKYMREDMTQTSVRREGEEPIPSSLALLTSALKNLGDIHWKDRERDAVGSALLSYREQVCIASTSTKQIPTREFAMRWIECSCISVHPSSTSTSKYDTVSLLTGSTASYRVLSHTNVVRTYNSSSPCHLRTTGSLLIGYLIRLMVPQEDNGGTYLQLGCSRTHFDHIPSRVSVYCVDLTTSRNSGKAQYATHTFTSIYEFVSVGLLEFEHRQFDLISIEWGKNFADVQAVVREAISVVKDTGVVLIHGGRPSYPYESRESTGLQPFYYFGDLWKLIVELRIDSSLDTAMGDFDGGVVIVTKRRNPMPLGTILPNVTLTVKNFLYNVDCLIPLLNLNEIDYWLHHENATLRYVAPPNVA